MREEGGGKNTDAQEVTPPPLCIVYGRARGGAWENAVWAPGHSNATGEKGYSRIS